MNSTESGRFAAPQPPPRGALSPAAPAEITTAEAPPDCEKVATVLDKVESGQATHEDVEYLIDHANDCSPCFKSIEKQRLFVSFLQSSLQLKGVPSELAVAIRESIGREVAAG